MYLSRLSESTENVSVDLIVVRRHRHRRRLLQHRRRRLRRAVARNDRVNVAVAAAGSDVRAFRDGPVTLQRRTQEFRLQGVAIWGKFGKDQKLAQVGYSLKAPGPRVCMRAVIRATQVFQDSSA